MRPVITRTLPKNPFKGMIEMFTTPRAKEADVVKSILRKNDIKFRSREEERETGWRYCIYTPSKSKDRVYHLLDEELSERGM